MDKANACLGIVLTCVIFAVAGCAGGGGVQVITEGEASAPQAAAAPVLVAIEAEAGQITDPMVVKADAAASGGKFIVSNAWESGKATYSFEVPVAGEYVVWARVSAPDASTDSFFVSANGVMDIFDAAEDRWGAWHWRTLNGRGVAEEVLYLDPRVLQLDKGANTLIFEGREPDCQLDKLIITNDMDFRPKD